MISYAFNYALVLIPAILETKAQYEPVIEQIGTYDPMQQYQEY